MVSIFRYWLFVSLVFFLKGNVPKKEIKNTPSESNAYTLLVLEKDKNLLSNYIVAITHDWAVLEI